MKTRISVIFIGLLALGSAHSACALTTDELVRLKKAGLSDDVIVFMSENDYNDASKVLVLKEVGYKDESILAIVKSEIKKKFAPATTQAPAEQKIDLKTTARVKIIWYRIFHGKPLLQNKEALEDAQISIAGKTLQINWEKKGGMDPLNAFQKEPFETPFYWELNENDTFGPGQEGYLYHLQTKLDHQGKPDGDGSHYWALYLEPQDPKLIDLIKNVLSNK